MNWFNAKHRKTGTDDRTVNFSHAIGRENIKSGEKHSTLFGKIARYLEDLKMVAFTGNYNDLTGRPSAFPPSSHKHTKSEITDFPSSMPASDVPAWAKAAKKPSYSWSEIGSKPSTFTPSSHSHDYLPLSGGTMTGTLKTGHLAGTTNDRVYVDNGIEAGGFAILPHADNHWIYYMGGRLGMADGMPNYHCLRYYQASGYFELTPDKDGIGYLGASALRFGVANIIDIYNSSGIITTSDRNKKKDFEEITLEFARKIINGLIPTSFLYKDGTSGRRHYGMIAQDIEKLLAGLGIDSKDFAPLVKKYPDKTIKVKSVDENGEEIETDKLVPDYDAEPEYHLRYDGFTGIIIRYMQGLEQENQELKSTVQMLLEKMEQLESTVQSLSEKIKQLENRLNRLETGTAQI